MDITGSLVTALMLLGLGMAFVYMFLGLLFICITLMAKFIPADKPVAPPQRKKTATPNASASDAQVSPQVVAAITSAVQQYRKAQAV
jgi:oxaloacetate decarboxylase gamma subunit